jgi:NAD(P)-dependent dehydrogenase (short-subunit alcohol dehydrogenase family)
VDPIDMDYPGTGVAISILLARLGSRIAVLDRDPSAAQRTAEAIVQEGGAAIAVRCDITAEDQVRGAIEYACESYGSVTHLVNNAGIMADPKPVTEVPHDEWDRIFSVNVRAMALVSKHALRFMSRGSSIVNISSTTASRPHRNRGAYPVSKGAVNSFTTSLAVDCGPKGIRVNAVAPGSIWTPLSRTVLLEADSDPVETRERRANDTTLLRTVGTAWDVAHAVVFLCSQASRWITGQILLVDGGGSVLWGGRGLPLDEEL